MTVTMLVATHGLHVPSKVILSFLKAYEDKHYVNLSGKFYLGYMVSFPIKMISESLLSRSSKLTDTIVIKLIQMIQYMNR